jgi:uncharacterized protein YqcC (DUF446 family)
MPAALELYARAGEMADRIEAELKRIGMWQEAPLPEDRFEDMGAFGYKTMAFEQWLQFVLLPRVRDIIASEDDFPEESEVGVYALRAFDSYPDADGLSELLIAFDSLFNN